PARIAELGDVALHPDAERVPALLVDRLPVIFPQPDLVALYGRVARVAIAGLYGDRQRSPAVAQDAGVDPKSPGGNRPRPPERRRQRRPREVVMQQLRRLRLDAAADDDGGKRRREADASESPPHHVPRQVAAAHVSEPASPR